MTETDDVTIEIFPWRKKVMACEICGRTIGRWAFFHSHRCQSCNLKIRMKRDKEKEARVSA